MQGTISFDGTLSGGITGGGGGGSEVTITPVLTEGEKIADYSINGESGSLYAPEAEALPSTIVTKALRKYNDTSQTKILTITTLDTENSQEVSQDIYAPSPVQCWYTPGLEQDYQIGQFTYGGVTQNVYIPYFQRPLTAGANITIDQNNVISASSGGGGVNYSTAEQDTGITWIDGSHIYQKTVKLENIALTAAAFITRNVSDYFSDVSVLISYESIILSKNTNAYYLMPYSLSGNLEPYSANVSIVGNEIDITTGNQFTAINTDIYITLKYTKSV